MNGFFEPARRDDTPEPNADPQLIVAPNDVLTALEYGVECLEPIMQGRAFSHYRVLEKLGQGGMGVVYLAEDTLLGRRVAIKFPAATAVHRRRLLDEARAASALNHPNIAAVYDCGEFDESLYIVMELVEGLSVSDLLAGEPPSVERSADIVGQVAEALREAHGHHIVHRDIKPSNIRVDRRGRVKVVDFGLAKTLQQSVGTPGDQTQTVEGIISGTPHYMSPEQARGESGDERSDLFSLGVVLYECLTGKSPFRAATAVDTLAKVLEVDPPPASELNPAVPPAMDRIVSRALAKDPGRRYQSAAEMLGDLRQVGAAGAQARYRWRAVVGALLAAAVLGPVWWLWQGRSYQPRPEALRWYEQGAAAIRDSAYYSATKALERSVNLDAKFAPAHARLADAYNELDDTHRAQRHMLAALAPGVGRSSPSDRLIVQAIQAMLTRDFSAAEEIYRTLLHQAAAKDKPSLYLDLGRAYDKDQKPKEAIECYEQAVRHSPDYPAAFLRLGILRGRMRRGAEADAAFNQAGSLYRALSSVEGETEVLYQRAIMATEVGQFDDAAALLKRAFEMATAAGNNHQSIAVLLHTGFVEVKKGDTVQAEQHITAALDLARRMGLEVLVMRGLYTLGGLYVALRDAQRAEKTLQQVLEFARRFDASRSEAAALFMLGSLHIQTADYDRGIQEVTHALPFFERGEYHKERSMALMLIARARRAKGDYQGALAGSREQLEAARKTGDLEQLALAHESIGTIQLALEHYADALASFRARTETARSTGNERGVAYGLVQSATTLAKLGRYPEATATFERARTMLPLLATSIDLAAAEMQLSQRHFAAARDLVRRMDLGNLNDDSRIEAQRILCVAEASLGARREGVRLCREALDQARASGRAPLVCRTLLSYGEAAVESGDARAALVAARTAQQEYSNNGQKESEAAAWLVAARAAQGSEAREFATRGLQSLDALAAVLNGEDRQSFNSRPDVQQWRRQARAILDRR